MYISQASDTQPSDTAVCHHTLAQTGSCAVGLHRPGAHYCLPAAAASAHTHAHTQARACTPSTHSVPLQRASGTQLYPRGPRSPCRCSPESSICRNFLQQAVQRVNHARAGDRWEFGICTHTHDIVVDAVLVRQQCAPARVCHIRSTRRLEAVIFQPQDMH